VVLPSQGEWRDATFSPAGEQVAAVSESAGVCLFRAADGQPVTRLPSTVSALTVGYSSAGNLLAVRMPNEVVLFDPPSGERRHGFREVSHDPLAPPPRFSPEGGRLAMATAPDGVRVWDTRTGRPLTDVLPHAGRIRSLAFSPDGQLLVVGCGTQGDFSRGERGLGEARVWAGATGRLLHVLPHPASVTVVCFSPDGRLLVTGCASGWRAEKAYRWDSLTFTERTPSLVHSDGVAAIVFRPDSSLLATADNGGVVRLWDAASGQPVGRPMRHQRGVGALAFSPDGRWLVSSATDGTARLWDGATGEALSPWWTLSGTGYRVEFSPDGRRALTVAWPRSAEPSEIRWRTLEIDRRPVFELRRLAESLAGFSLDAHGVERTVGAEELLGRLRHGD